MIFFRDLLEQNPHQIRFNELINFQIFHTKFSANRSFPHHEGNPQGADHNLKDKETQNSLQRHLDVTCGKFG